MKTLTSEKLPEQVGAFGPLTDSYAAPVTPATNANVNAVKMKNILAVVKPAQSSVDVLKHAGWLAFQLGCEITLLHAVPKGCTPLAPGELQSEFTRLTGMSATQIRAILVRPATLGISPILEAVRDEHADLVVIHANFYKKPLHFWQTDMMEKLIRHLQCPLLIIGEKSPGPVTT